MKKCYLIVFLCICAAAVLHAQDARLYSNQKSHKFSWQAAPDAAYYEIEIQRQDNTGTYRSFRSEQSTGTTLELMFGPGLYRSRLIVHDFLGMTSEPSQWLYFEIKPAAPPGMELTEGEIPVEEPKSEDAAGTAEPAEPEPEPAETPAEAAAEAPAEPPSEPEKPDTAIYSNNMFINTSFYFMPLVPAYGSLDENIDGGFLPNSFAVRMGPMVRVSDTFNFGFDIEPGWARIDYQRDSVSMGVNMTRLNANIEFQHLQSAGRFAINYHVGCGIMFFQNTSASKSAAPTFDPFWAVDAGLGFSFGFYFTEHAAINAGLSYYHVFIAGDPPLGFVMPMFGIAFRI